MIDKIFEYALRQRAFVLIAATALVFIGAWSAWTLPIDAVPDITNVQVQINTAVPSLAPEEIEKLVTYPVEIEMGGIEKLSGIRSISKPGLSQVSLIFEEGTDIYRARQLAGERLQAVLDELPPGVTPKLAPITTGLGEIYHYTIHYKEGFADAPADPVERLRQLKLAQDHIVKPALRVVPGVTEVNTSGGYDKQILIMPHPARLAAAGLTVDDIANVISENVANAGGSIVEKGAEAVTIRATGRVQTTEEIATLPLKFTGRAAPALLIRDVAEVAIGSGVRTGAATHDGEEAVLGSVLMLIGQNSRAVSARIHDRIAGLNTRLPPGMEIRTVYNRTDLVDATIATVEKNLFEGAILVIAVLIALLGNWRAALIVATAIPLSMLFAVTGMARYGISGNLMSLGAVDFGLIVDGAVVMAENIVRMLAHRQKHLGRLLAKRERLHTILAASKQVGAPTVFGVAIITIVYLPMFTLTGTEGKMFTPMAFTVVFALIGALLLALTLVPVLCSFLMGGKISEEDNAIIRLAKRAYAPVLRFSLRRRWPLLALAAGTFVFSLHILGRLGAEFIPQLDEGSLAAQMIRTTSIGLTPSVEMQKAAERVMLEKFPEVTHTFSRIGTSEVATDPMGVNVGDSYILMKPPSAWRKINGRRITKDEITNLMSKELSTRFPGQSYLFSQPIQLRFNELLSGSRADIAIKVFGDNYDTLEQLAGEIREIVEKIPGAADVEFDAAGKSPVLRIKPDRAAMARYNVQTGAVNRVIETAFAGHESGVIVDGNRRYPIITRLAETARQDFAAAGDLTIRTSDGGTIALRQVADVSVAESVNTITREAFQRRIAIQINLRGRDVQGFVDEAREKIAAQITLPEGYFVEYGGAFKNLQEARQRLTIVVPAALALIFLLIFMAFGSLRQALLVYSGIPLAITGGVLALWIRGLPFSISAAVGFIALSGVAVLNGVMMITFINQLREEGRTVREAVIEGALTRLRPVLMTALVASLGFVPMALARGSGAEVQRPLATVVIGGIISATLLTLVLLPALYDWCEQRTRKPDPGPGNPATTTPAP
ncbi:MAG: CusA/CzcA family heavy metal efflux RND transporter [Opitutaceae bacterium]|jgi:cobalt-zinc-cadmium resistance protein CzcA|nr:CusA/CzcA family heavy metal efflux RND transporter [Opitutaceae bacterium]